MNLKIYPPEEILEATIHLPLSKSMSARALIMNALTFNAPRLTADQVADCDDTHAMLKALSARTIGDINIGAAGTAMRFLTAYYASIDGADIILDGTERMRHRPIKILVDALRKLGADIDYTGEEGFPPLHIHGRHLNGGNLNIEAGISSQYISAIMMVAPLCQEPLKITFEGNVSSLPYIKMTAEMMQRRGINIELTRDGVEIANGSYQFVENDIEADFSAASYWYEIAALTAGFVTLPAIKENSLQGDSAVARIFPQLGVLTEYTTEGAELSATPDLYGRIELDMTDTPDLVQTVVATACTVGIPFRLTGVRSLRIKETDRLYALCRETAKLGCNVVTEGDNAIIWDGERTPILEAPVIDTYDDHRMAMAFAPVSVFLPGIVIKDVDVVSKSYPNFWKDLESAGFTLVDAENAPQSEETID
jgi:3-phosphoshikimate 1-carboxyvinyltransferase